METTRRIDRWPTSDINEFDIARTGTMCYDATLRSEEPSMTHLMPAPTLGGDARSDLFRKSERYEWCGGHDSRLGWLRVTSEFLNGINLQRLVAVVVDDVHRDLADRRRIERATG
jgi:hypothetical protein